MASAIGGLAAKAGHTVEVMSRDPSKAQALAERIGPRALTREFGAAPAGHIVILAVPTQPFWTWCESRQGIQHIAFTGPGCRLGRGPSVGRVHRWRRPEGEGARLRLHREPWFALDGCRTADHGVGVGARVHVVAGPYDPLRQPRQLLDRRQPSRLSLPLSISRTAYKGARICTFRHRRHRHIGPYIISDLIAAGHEVTALVRSDTAAAAVSTQGAKAAAEESDGVIHIAHRQDLLPSGGLNAVAAAETEIMLAYGDALAGTGKPLVVSGSIGSPGWEGLGRPATEEDPPFRHDRQCWLSPGADRAGEGEGRCRLPGDGTNLWPAVHSRDLASLFRLALEKGPAGKSWHGVEGDGIQFREIAEAIGARLGVPAVSIPLDVLMLPGYFGFLANLVTLDLPASNLITRQTLGWEPTQPRLLADLGNGHYFPAA
ncbi:hypothetical protein DdX_22019 [Ditylenchus destructor]|uniref:Pyrroline-5-carboxylate reductase catalytic N-terminal domain-containing protein n=1 Tax=Ditylenchus destructor TaxID=166010 RepID=A0AAD4MI48_9BILA|nr:hypothetical protein DdX_22019 [Ditylenchus destructor]